MDMGKFTKIIISEICLFPKKCKTGNCWSSKQQYHYMIKLSSLH